MEPFDPIEPIPPTDSNVGNKLIGILSTVLGIGLVILAILQVTGSLSSLFGFGGSRTTRFEPIVVPATLRSDRVLPELPDEARFEDFIGEFPDEFYLTISQALIEANGFSAMGLSAMAFAEANSVMYVSATIDGAITQIIIDGDTTLVREGGRGSFSEVDTPEETDLMIDSMASIIRAMQFQYSISRQDFDDIDVSILGYEQVAGRDVIVYELSDGPSKLTVYLDVDTNLVLRLVNHSSADPLWLTDFDVFKTCGFSFPQ